MKKAIFVFLALLLTGCQYGIHISSKKSSPDSAAKTQECFECGEPSEIYSYIRNYKGTAYYKCETCGAKMTFIVNGDNEWELQEYTKKVD